MFFICRLGVEGCHIGRREVCLAQMVACLLTSLWVMQGLRGTSQLQLASGHGMGAAVGSRNLSPAQPMRPVA